MFLKALTALALASAASLLFTMTAEANPRFTVENDSKKKVTVYIFSGDDGICSFEEKQKTVKSGNTASFGCHGHGTGRCKIMLYVNDEQVCRSDRDTCNTSAIKMRDGETVTLYNKDKKFRCYYED